MIFKREITRNLKGLIIWGIILCGLVIMMLSIYPQFAENQKSMNEMLKAYPEGLKKAFGMDKIDFGTILGFYGVEIYLMNTLFGSIYVSLLASNIIAKEGYESTIEFLLSKPVLRTQIVTEKLLAVIVNVLLLNGAITIISLIGFKLSKDAQVPMDTFALLMLGTTVLHLTFAAISFLLSTIMKKSRNILSVSLGLVLVSYFFHVISGVSDKLENLKYLSFFKYVDASDIITNNSIQPLYLGIMFAVIIISIGSAYRIYYKKDIAV
jgi:ABC-2 type transport system permease protein